MGQTLVAGIHPYLQLVALDEATPVFVKNLEHLGEDRLIAGLIVDSQSEHQAELLKVNTTIAILQGDVYRHTATRVTDVSRMYRG